VFPQYATVMSRIDVHRAQQAHSLRQALELEIVRLQALQPGVSLNTELRAAAIRNISTTDPGSWQEPMRRCIRRRLQLVLGPQTVHRPRRLLTRG
jgi:hypothetical protein